MMESKVLIALFFSICYAENRAPSNSISNDLPAFDSEVIHVSILFRHGDRTPTTVLPTDPPESSYWEDGLKELTKRGILRSYELGKWTRQYYAALVANKPYRHDLITIQSSTRNRTLMSAEAFLAGLYPPSDEEMWNKENLRWQPIPVHSIPPSSDNIIAFPEGICEKYDLELHSLGQDPELVTFYEEYRDIFEYIRIHSGLGTATDDLITAIRNICDVYDNLLVHVQNNRTIQDWAHEVFTERLKPVLVLNNYLITYTSELKRLRGGPLLKSMIDDMTKKASGSLGNAVFHIYSGHDTTIIALLNTLGVYNGISTPYSAAVMVELRKKYEDYFVRVLYRNSSLVPPYTLKISGCEKDNCTLDEFIRVTASLIPDDWQNECKVDNLKYIVIGGCAVVFVVVLIAIAAKRC